MRVGVTAGRFSPKIRPNRFLGFSRGFHFLVFSSPPFHTLVLDISKPVRPLIPMSGILIMQTHHTKQHTFLPVPSVGIGYLVFLQPPPIIPFSLSHITTPIKFKCQVQQEIHRRKPLNPRNCLRKSWLVARSVTTESGSRELIA